VLFRALLHITPKSNNVAAQLLRASSSASRGGRGMVAVAAHITSRHVDRLHDPELILNYNRT
jgi:hypothetical protein